MAQTANSSFGQARRLRGAKAREFSLVNEYRSGYRNREDITMLPPGILVAGSQNVVTNVSGRIGVVKGYQLDGPASAVLAPILATYDYEMHTGTIQHLRAGFLTSVANADGKLQYRYVDGSGTVTYRDLLKNLTSVSFNFADYWNTTTVQSLLLMVNGASSITEWTGGVTTVASVTSTTITKSGTQTWAELGFYTTGTHKVTINGTDYTATGGWGTTTLTGVTPDPVLGGVVAGDIAHQTPETTLNSSMTAIPTTLHNDLIATLNNQAYIGSFLNRSVYVSKNNNYKDYTVTTPVRVVGDGGLLTLDANPIGFVQQEEEMYITAGKDQWYQTSFTLSSDLSKEALDISRLKTVAQEASMSQAFINKIKDNIVFVSNEPIMKTLGRVTNVLLTPQMTNISDSIVNDMNSYDFTDGCMFYWKNFAFIAVPKHNLVRIYNMTDLTNKYWEAPVGYPISRFSIIDGDLYGHSYQTSESYKLFTGYNFNGNSIAAQATFSFNNYGTRPASKSFNEFYIEGYISGNTTLTSTIQYDIDGCATSLSNDILGTNTRIVCIGSDDNSLGKNSLGSSPLGGNLNPDGPLPPKFRGILTFPRVPFYEEQTTFSSEGVDFQWEIIAFGNNQVPSSEGNNAITI